ncbi:MAG: methyl-accepting chemotaxis protein [Vicinamibacterales bacterium]
MSLTRKVVLVAILPVIALGIVLSFVFARVAEQQHQQVTQEYVVKARSVVLSAESMREEMGNAWAQGSFSAELLRDWAAKGQRERVLTAVPVVTAWRAAMKKAQEGGYEFRVPKFQPRNPKNEPDPIEARVLRLFESEGLNEHWEIDEARNAVRYFRPIRLTQECLLCHGDPATSKAQWGNDQGLDPTGGRMENWKVGEVHGAFEIVQSMAAADAARSSMVQQFLLIVLACLIVTIPAVLWFTRRSLVRPLTIRFTELREGSEQVLAAANEVSASSQHLAAGATEQASSIEETSASMEQMRATTQHNTSRTEDASRLMSDVDTSVQASNASLNTMVASMEAIAESSQKVSNIIRTIDEIAFQTNLLALNAAVEAARAGQAGMGFAVVADEVRALAHRSAEAAKGTAALIEESIQRANAGASQVQAVTGSITGIAVSVSRVRQLMGEVNAGSREQAEGISQVTSAVQQMQQVTQTTAAEAEQSAATAEELNAQAETTLGTVRELNSFVLGGDAAAGLSAPARRRSMGKGRILAGPAATAEAPETPLRTGTYGGR